MTNHNTMTIDQCRDEIAEKVLGWNRVDPIERIGHDEWWRPTNSGSPGSRTWCIHPLPDRSTDAALAAMPNGWSVFLKCLSPDDTTKAKAWESGNGQREISVSENKDGLPTTAWRLCVAAWRKEKGL